MEWHGIGIKNLLLVKIKLNKAATKTEELGVSTNGTKSQKTWILLNLKWKYMQMKLKHSEIGINEIKQIKLQWKEHKRKGKTASEYGEWNH